MRDELKLLSEQYPPKRKTSNVRIKYPDVFLMLQEYTSFLPDKSSTSQRLWHVRNETQEVPTCKNPICEKKTNWIAKYSDYAQYCSKNCHNKHKTLKASESEDKRQKALYGDNYKDLSTEEKSKITNLRKYGVDNPFKDVERIKKANQEKYGRDYHFQKHIDKDILDKLNDPEWLYEQNKVLNRSCIEIAEELGINNTTVNKKLHSFNITPSYNYASSFREKKIAMFLEDIGLDVVENDRSIINPHELDIYLPKNRLAIEYCGLYWHNELHKDINYHANKYKLCKEKGIQLLTIYEDEFIDKEPIVLSSLKHKIGNSTENRIYARKCEVSKVTALEKKEFFNATHIQGDGNSSINIALTYQGEIVACAAFMKYGEDLTLNRFSTSCIISGALSKILKYVSKNYRFTQIITFADLRWSDGRLYEQSGFVKDKIIRPDYYYVYNNTRYHKFNFRHSKLKRILPNYDPSLSEHKNCINHRIYRIYDCGKIRYTYTP